MAKGLSASLFLLLASCASVAPKAGGPFTILAVGESLTALSGAESWPAQLERLLAEDCPGVKVQSWAVPGSDSAEAAARLPAGLSIFKPQAVIAMLGINDYEGVTPKFQRWVGHEDGAANAHFEPFGSLLEYEERLLGLMRAQPYNDRRFIYLFARPYRDSGRIDEEEGIVRGILATRPWNPWALAELGTLLRFKKQWVEAEKLHRRAFESEPGEVHLLQEWLADFAAEEGFEAAYQQALKLTKNHRPVHFVAASFYQAHNLREKHEKVMRKLVAEGCDTRKCAVMLRVALVRNGKMKEAETVKLPPFPEPITATRENYRSIGLDLENYRTPYFLMQYPLMPPEYLARLGLEPVAIIPNDHNFRTALENQPYDALFADRFAGDFGHFRPGASRLVAESAAAQLLPWAREKGYCR